MTKRSPSPLGRGLGGGADVSHTNRLRLEALHRYSPLARSSSGPRHRPAGVRWAAEPLSSRTRRRAHRIHIDDSLLNGNRRGYRAGGGHRRYQDAKPASRAWLEQVSQRCTFVQQLFRNRIYGCALTSGFVGHSRMLYWNPLVIHMLHCNIRPRRASVHPGGSGHGFRWNAAE
jgi:hypothetical protein